MARMSSFTCTTAGEAEKVALFRYALIAPFVLETLPRGELTRRAQQIAARHYEIPHSGHTSVSVGPKHGRFWPQSVRIQGK